MPGKLGILTCITYPPHKSCVNMRITRNSWLIVLVFYGPSTHFRSFIAQSVRIVNSLWEETALVNVSIIKGDLKCQKMMLSDMPNRVGWGRGKVIRRYTGCNLQTFVKQYNSTISPLFFRDSHLSCSRMPVKLPVS